ncbi:iron complex transport system ATP-binding protein [Pullulanibacillus pueri]|uniref:Putative ABC transporter ATP-binding protein YlmA n=1 Tax=Pullulanibacillus pueri TaxID=1437324 RepID=A0A8J2ZU95_9BACL|nr:ABC transporter ATP-binding protein [Pullulanibacillus pueri]MBM7681410.1 iron complex transport system ATP-binding protein [Pullulanibacillus pueri]GGH78766.1 putative ABC transporter ATP-binding protein YlmA [Pullulanibacillus pueri]
MIVDIENVSWKREKQWILKDISWQIRQGEHWSLVGLNGSGKTTLLNMINGYIWPTKGSISVLDQTFGRCDLRELRKDIGWVSSSLQQHLHGEETAKHIVISGKFATIGLYDQVSTDIEEQAEQLLTLLNCQIFKDRRYDTLSQGERQRILIARALMAEPKLLILDEPCTGLDIIAREQLLQIIEKVSKAPQAPTLIYVTHHVEEILPCFSHTLMLKKGEVYQLGPTEKVLTSTLLTDFFDTPIKVYQQQERLWLTLA